MKHLSGLLCYRGHPSLLARLLHRHFRVWLLPRWWEGHPPVCCDVCGEEVEAFSGQVTADTVLCGECIERRRS